jgi:gluconolactonase
MRDRLRLLFLVAALMAVAALSARAQANEVVRLDPAADAVIPADAHVEKLADDFGFLEGPVWVHKGNQQYLLFSDIPANVIDKWTPDGKVSVFLEKSGFTGTDPSDVGMQINNGKTMVTLIGSNAITLDKRGRIVFCTHGDHAVVRLEKNGKRTVLASEYDGKRLNSPNDLVVGPDGSIYFTDPPAGLRKGDDDPKKQLPFDGVYRIVNGEVQLLAKDFSRPNGIAFSPDYKYLYINDTLKKVIRRYVVQPDGGITGGEVITDMTGDVRPGAPDGMKVDQKGNIYCTGPGGFWIMSPEGKHLATVQPPELPANMAWGDPDGKTLYLTARTGLYRIRLSIPGVRP